MHDTATASRTDTAHDGARDFDFELGHWTVHNRRLRERLAGCTAWDTFDATVSTHSILDGLGNQEEMRSEHLPGYIGMAFRFYNRAARCWAIHWVDNQRGVLEPPVHGTFRDGIGVFEGDDVFEGRPIRVRFVWTATDPAAPRWEQAFSDDGGMTWETNWTMVFRRRAA